MEIEQRIGRIDRIGQKEETILVVNFVNDSTIDERILTRLLDRIDIFESSIGATRTDHLGQCTEGPAAGFDFTLTGAQREQKVREALPRSRSSASACKSSPNASSALLVSNDGRCRRAGRTTSSERADTSGARAGASPGRLGSCDAPPGAVRE